MVGDDEDLLFSCVDWRRFRRQFLDIPLVPLLDNLRSILKICIFLDALCLTHATQLC